MAVEHWQLIAVLFGLFFLLAHGSARRWRERASVLEEQLARKPSVDDDSNFRYLDEVRFWRRHFDSDAAEAVEESQ